MLIYRCILSKWAEAEYPGMKKVLEGKFSDDKVVELNAKGYNIYYLPNYPSDYTNGTVDGSTIDMFQWAFVDMDLKDGRYATKEEFLIKLSTAKLLPTKVVDSGHGIHAYWRVSDLDALSYLKLQRRLIVEFKTDEAVGQIYQLMRHAPSVNVKHRDAFKDCTVISEVDCIYNPEDLDTWLPKLTHEDGAYCLNHYNTTYRLEEFKDIKEEMPAKFWTLVKDNPEVKEIQNGTKYAKDRSAGDYRLAHLLFASNFTKDEVASVLINSPKALERAPIHRLSYAQNILNKIWTAEVLEQQAKQNNKAPLSESVADILKKGGVNLKGTRIYCHKYLDNTQYGFRLGQIIGLVAGSGVGKTSLALNMFKGFVEHNPEYDHFFVPLEQPANEIAERWQTLCGDNTRLHGKVHIISNYDEEGGFRHLSLDEIKEYILKFKKDTGKKVGSIVIDHIGVLRGKGSNGENQDLISICKSLKSFATATNAMVIMQSQAPREKAGIGDLELNKDAAYGTVYFESYCDYLMTLWQPLKRCYSEQGCPTIMAIKFCKIRHKKQHKDIIQEDVCYKLLFDPETEQVRELSPTEEKSFPFWNQKATNKRKLDRKTDLVEYKSMVFGPQEIA